MDFIGCNKYWYERESVVLNEYIFLWVLYMSTDQENDTHKSAITSFKDGLFI